MVMQEQMRVSYSGISQYRSPFTHKLRRKSLRLRVAPGVRLDCQRSMLPIERHSGLVPEESGPWRP